MIPFSIEISKKYSLAFSLSWLGLELDALSLLLLTFSPLAHRVVVEHVAGCLTSDSLGWTHCYYLFSAKVYFYIGGCHESSSLLLLELDLFVFWVVARARARLAGWGWAFALALESNYWSSLPLQFSTFVHVGGCYHRPFAHGLLR